MRYLFEILGRPDSAGLTIASAGGAALSSGPGAGMSQSVIVSALWLMVLVLLNAAQAQSTARPKKSLDDLLAESDGIVVGTVSDVKARYVKDREIHTFVTLIDLEIVWINNESEVVGPRRDPARDGERSGKRSSEAR